MPSDQIRSEIHTHKTQKNTLDLLYVSPYLRLQYASRIDSAARAAYQPRVDVGHPLDQWACPPSDLVTSGAHECRRPPLPGLLNLVDHLYFAATAGRPAALCAATAGRPHACAWHGWSTTCMRPPGVVDHMHRASGTVDL